MIILIVFMFYFLCFCFMETLGFDGFPRPGFPFMLSVTRGAPNCGATSQGRRRKVKEKSSSARELQNRESLCSVRWEEKTCLLRTFLILSHLNFVLLNFVSFLNFVSLFLSPENETELRRPFFSIFRVKNNQI